MWSQLLVASNLGVMLFFSVLTAPSIFKVLPAEWAAVYVRSFFPKYYAYLAFVSFGASFLATEVQTMIITVVCGTFFVVLTTYLTPGINAAKDAGKIKKFDFLHKLSVLINLIQIVLFVYILIPNTTST